MSQVREVGTSLVDAHCHLADDQFVADLEAVIARARDAGLTRALCVIEATDENERRRAARIAELWPGVRFAAGVHPHRAARVRGVDAVETTLETAWAEIGQVCAVGEVGLDYHHQFAPPEIQREVFRRQVQLARARGWPLVIHTREADEDTFRILREEGAAEVGGVFHCFTGDAARARRVVELGFAVSFAGIVTFRRASAVREATRVVPPDRLLVETDAPYLAPEPYRGRRNEPAYVAAVLEAVAAVRGESVPRVAQATAAVFDALFRPRPPAPGPRAR